MTDAINAKTDVLGERELDAVSGGTKSQEQENKKQMEALKTFRKALEGII